MGYSEGLLGGGCAIASKLAVCNFRIFVMSIRAMVGKCPRLPAHGARVGKFLGTKFGRRDMTACLVIRQQPPQVIDFLTEPC